MAYPKGRPRGPQSESHRHNLSNAKKGVKMPPFTEEARRNMDLSVSRNWNGIKPLTGSRQKGNVITEEQFWSLVTNQACCCWMCNKSLLEGGSIVVDHDHETGKIRGIAHRICNLHYHL